MGACSAQRVKENNSNILLKFFFFFFSAKFFGAKPACLLACPAQRVKENNSNILLIFFFFFLALNFLALSLGKRRLITHEKALKGLFTAPLCLPLAFTLVLFT